MTRETKRLKRLHRSYVKGLGEAHPNYGISLKDFARANIGFMNGGEGWLAKKEKQ